MNITTFEFPNIGCLLADVPPELQMILSQRVQKALANRSQEISANHKLIGHLKEEYKTPDLIKVFEPFLMSLVLKYEDKFEYLKSIDILQEDGFCVLDSLWLNLQSKFEYNPIHIHDGVFSFVIWISIPYKFSDENKIFPDLPLHKQKNGRFEFYYTDALGRIRHFSFADSQNLENKICLFPSVMRHAVYPFFTSDEYRISFSGNIKLTWQPET